MDRGGTLVMIGIIFLALVTGLGMVGCPQYNVYKARLDGEAELAQAQQNRQIAIQEAQAKKESAILLKDAEVIRAQGVAQAANIIQEKLTESYLRYLWIIDVATPKQGDKEIVYIPTEANIPLPEVGRKSQSLVIQEHK